MQSNRVLYISYNGVTEPITNSQIMPYLKGLSPEGYSFDLLTFEKKEGPFQTKERLGTVKGQMKDAGIRWHHLAYHKRPSLPATIYDIAAGTFYASYLICKHRYLLVHARQIVPAAICVVLKVLFGIRWIFDMRGLVAEEYVGHGSWREGGVKFKSVKWLEKRALLSAIHIVVLTERHREYLLSLPFAKERNISVSVIPCCVDMARFVPAGSDERKALLKGAGLQDSFVLIYVGSLGTCYFLDKMFEFFKKLKTRVPQATFLFLTDHDKGKIMSEAAKAKIDASSVRIMFAEPSAVHNWVASADAGIYFINPYKKFGSCPIKMGEYLASGLPLVVNSGIGDSDAMIEDDDIGVVLKGFTEEDYDRAAEKLLALSRDKQVRDRCVRSAGTHLCLESGLKRYREIYDKIKTKRAECPKKILFIVPYTSEGASNRIRIEQYLPYLADAGIRYKVRPFFFRSFYKILYTRGHFLKKTLFMAISTMGRIADIFRCLNYDVICVHREAYPIGPSVFEHIFSAIRPMIYDFDDAIYLPNTSKQNFYIERFKKPGKVSEIIEMSKVVIAGNDHLKNYALKYNENVIVIPSSIDTDKYRPLSFRGPKKGIVIGWIGSNTTKDFLYDLEDVFVRLSKRFDNLTFKIAGAQFQSKKLSNVISREWYLEKELDILRTFDIGIMPMPDNEWTRGKCGFKAILYMSLEIPTVCSPVGVNRSIIEDGVNGFLADSADEWEDRLSSLIKDKDLRKRIGLAGRRTVEMLYSVKANANKFIDVINKRERYSENI